MKTKSLPPYAPTLIESTRAIGYSLEAAVADIIDNSIAANATSVDIYFFPVDGAYIAILDNGKGQEIRMVANDEANGLFGYYNGNVIFKVTQDLTMTERILVNNGADFTTIKYVPRKYNGVGCLMHVKSGGTS